MRLPLTSTVEQDAGLPASEMYRTSADAALVKPECMWSEHSPSVQQDGSSLRAFLSQK